MNIHEYQAKEVLRKYGVPTSHGVVILKEADIDSVIDNFDAPLYVVKAQIHAGGRGKGGGVKVVKTKDEAKAAAHKMWGMDLITPQTGPEGQKVQRIYVESGCDIEKELYFSVILDTTTSRVTFVACTEGGVDIEEVAEKTPEKIIKVSVDSATGLQGFHCREVAFGLGFTGDQFKHMQKIVKSCYDAFLGSDASQIEINPLVITPEGDLRALDAKINLDDNALYKHPEIV